MTWAAVCARRLERHSLLDTRQPSTPAEVAGASCGAHAQILTAAELSIGLRIDGISRAAIRDALWLDHQLIKTYSPRGTVHLLSAADLSNWTGALSAVPRRPSPLPPAAQLTPAQADAVVAAIADALADTELTIDELTAAIVARTSKQIDITVEPLVKLSAAQRRALDGRVARVGSILEGEPRLTIGPITVGPHA